MPGWIKLEEEPTPAKAGRLVDGSPDVIVLGGLGGQMLIEELRHGSHGTMTGFGFPEILVAIVRRWFAGDRDGAAALFDRYATVVRFENQAVLNLGHPQGRLPAARRDRRIRPCGLPGCRPILGPSRTSTSSSAAPDWTGISRAGVVHGRRLT